MAAVSPVQAQGRNGGNVALGKIMKIGSVALGPFLIVLALTLFGLCAFACFTAVGPTVADTFSFTWWSLAIVGLFILANVLFNYAACVCTPPGDPKTLLSGVAASAGAAAPSAAATPAQCNKCDFLKPDRAHHDSVTGTCVLRFDHMCPWMFNSIGHFNYKYFYLFLAWLWAMCMYAVLLSWHAFFHKVYRNKTAYLVIEPSQWDSPELPQMLSAAGDFAAVVYPWVSRRQALRLTTLSFVLPMAAGLAVGGLLAWHTYLVFSNLTTVEWFINMKTGSRASNAVSGEIARGNQYSFGWRTNWQLVFGVHAWPLAWLLPSLAPPPGNGVEYPTLQQPQLLSRQLHMWHERYGASLTSYITGTPAITAGPQVEDGSKRHDTHSGRRSRPSTSAGTSDVLSAVPLPPQTYSFLESAQDDGFCRCGSPTLAFRRLQDLQRLLDSVSRRLRSGVRRR